VLVVFIEVGFEIEIDGDPRLEADHGADRFAGGFATFDEQILQRRVDSGDAFIGGKLSWRHLGWIVRIATARHRRPQEAAG
jgi:hypothetical protein